MLSIETTAVVYPIYLDYNATTPVHPGVREAMLPYLAGIFGNPSSAHAYGAAARQAVEKARGQVASLLGCKNHEIIFTSGGSESNNLAIKGIALAHRSKGNHIITSAIEHPAVAEVCKYLETQGFIVTWLPVDETGMVSPDDLAEAIRPETVLVSIMHANNEVGTIQPVRELAEIAHQKGVFFHTDAAQSAGKIPVNGLGADLLSIAGHKLYAPKGVGALYIREGVKLEKLIHGADHEHDIRAGTENVPFIVGLGKACEIALVDLGFNARHSREMRDLLQNELKELIPDVIFNGHPEQRLPNTLSLAFPGIDANIILSEIGDKVAASAGAACHAGGTDISPTLTAMHVPFETARGTIRFSTGRDTNNQEIRTAALIFSTAYSKLTTKNTSPNLTLNPQNLKLTHFTAGQGCACKLRLQDLEKILRSMPVPSHPDILVGTETSDDAAVYRISDEAAIVQTVDFITPVVDDPYDFGSIAAANALSDIYAMGAKPLFALNIVAFPSNRLPMEVLEQILKGAAEKAAEAGITIIGGHTIDDPEPKFGLAVTGRVHPDKIIRNKGTRPGDALILTKPIGTGIMVAAMKRGLIQLDNRQLAVGNTLTQKQKTLEPGTLDPWNQTISTMLALNRTAAEVMQSFPVSACTDVTGFGLLGHLYEMASASGVDTGMESLSVPLLPGVEEMASAGMVPGGTRNNLDYVRPHVQWPEGFPEFRKLILCDAITNGGLLIALPEAYVGRLLRGLSIAGVQAKRIGRVLSEGSGRIIIS